MFIIIKKKDFKGLYCKDNLTMEIKKIYGPSSAPSVIDSSCVFIYYRYDSGAKEFKEIHVKDFCNSVDAVVLCKNIK